MTSQNYDRPHLLSRGSEATLIGASLISGIASTADLIQRTTRTGFTDFEHIFADGLVHHLIHVIYCYSPLLVAVGAGWLSVYVLVRTARKTTVYRASQLTATSFVVFTGFYTTLATSVNFVVMFPQYLDDFRRYGPGGKFPFTDVVLPPIGAVIGHLTALCVLYFAAAGMIVACGLWIYRAKDAA